jgi:threonine-phosphate decarboxylase
MELKTQNSKLRTQSAEYREQSKDKKSRGSVLCVLPSESEHGGNIYRLAEEIGVPQNKIIDFSASINPLGVSKRVKDVIKKELDNLINYPDSETEELRETIAQYHGIDAETILCGNGSTELIYLIPRALKPRKVLIPAPTFSEYERACRTASCELRVKSYELKKENNFAIDSDGFISAMKGDRNSKLRTPNSKLKCYMVFLCNPNNPTGTFLKREDVLKIAHTAEKEKCFLVVDEAFIDFIPEESVIRDVKDNPYLIVLRSMTKFYALTGLRAGYGVFHKDLINKIKKVKEPWTVNTLAQKAAIVALKDSYYREKTVKLIRREKEFMEKNFKAMNIKFFPSSANYYLLRIKNAYNLIITLKRKGILLRQCSNFKGLDGSYIRIAVKSHRHNTLLIQELSRLCVE